MSPDTIDSLMVDLSDLLEILGFDISDDRNYNEILYFLHDKLEPFTTRDRNYN